MVTNPAPKAAAHTRQVPVLSGVPDSGVANFEAVKRTFAQMVQDRAEVEPEEVAFCQWDGTRAIPTTWAQYALAMREVALGLTALGVARGDRVAIMAPGRGEWVITALGILSAGAIPVGVYPMSSAAEVRQLVGHSEAVVMVVGDEADVAKIAAVARELPALRAMISFDGAPSGLPETVVSKTWADLRGAGRALDATNPALFDELLDGGDIDHTAALFYTSGSTGAPKGVIHTHRTLQYSILGSAVLNPELTKTRRDSVSFLGLSHVSPALSGVFSPIMTRGVVTFCRLDQSSEALRGVRPTGIVWPPRLHEKLLSGALAAVKASPTSFQEAYEDAMQVAREVAAARRRGDAVPAALQARYDRAQEKVFLPLRAKLGVDRVGVAWTASGAMTPEVHALWQMWGVDLRELYGTTETCGWVLAQWDRAFPPPGTVGKAMPDPRFVIKTSSEGELLVKGPLLFRGYWNDPEATAEVMDGEWYRTGDLVEIDASGEVKLIGRAKDIIITSGGKTISPQPLEVCLKASPLVEEAVVVGDGRKYLTVLIWPTEKGSRLDRDVLQEGLRALTEDLNTGLARPLQLKDFRIAPRALSPGAGELTAKGTIRRAAVLTSFSALVDEMYSAAEHNEFAGQARLQE
ncbi:AMP-dependent synthetase/ligase [Bradyrhizobium canariense]|uniref:Long-chain acyl-CoA synthetase n=1 Tax=Bradyrhizobium canariense TaxID=255045 RepID=A0A1H1V778_9BRAD|nr:AMP-binding protein [Bradyrhizobium canariense]SDS80555.1 long-chain acyl-CoA synthetase [Bradyrhizobium canariense]